MGLGRKIKRFVKKAAPVAALAGGAYLAAPMLAKAAGGLKAAAGGLGGKLAAGAAGGAAANAATGGAASGLGSTLGTLALGASLAGRQKGGESSAQGGYAALSPEGKAAYDTYFSMLTSLPADPYSTGRFEFAPKPTTPFESEELYKLQQLMGEEQGVKPVGVLEPFSQYQRNALQAYGEPDYSEQGLSAYMRPFEDMRNRTISNINRRADERLAAMRGREARIGSLGRDATYGGQLPQVEEARMRALLDAEAAYTDRALGLRQQSLADMLRAGEAIQQQNQAGLATASPSQIAMQSPLYGQAAAYQRLISQGMPTSSTQFSSPQRLNDLGRFGNMGLALFGNQLQQSLGGF